jgi:hypothetical protein
MIRVGNDDMLATGSHGGQVRLQSRPVFPHPTWSPLGSTQNDDGYVGERIGKRQD